MYEWRESFSLLAELSVAVVGFSGLIGALYANSRVSKASRAYLDIYYLLAYGIPALFGCLLPFIVFDWVMNEVAAWRLCSAVFLGLGVLIAVFFRKENRALLKRYPALSIPMAGGDVAMGLLLVANLSALFFEPSGRVYALALYWSFLGAIVGFTKVVSHTWSDGAQSVDSSLE